MCVSDEILFYGNAGAIITCAFVRSLTSSWSVDLMCRAVCTSSVHYPQKVELGPRVSPAGVSLGLRMASSASSSSSTYHYYYFAINMQYHQCRTIVFVSAVSFCIRLQFRKLQYLFRNDKMMMLLILKVKRQDNNSNEISENICKYILTHSS